MRKLALFIGFFLCAAGAMAQDRAGAVTIPPPATSRSGPAAAGFAPSRWQFAGGFQFNRFDIRGLLQPFTTGGLNVSAIRYFSPLLGVEAEVGAGFGSAAPGISASSIFAGAGPHFVYRRRSRFEPWLHVLIGVEHLHFGGPPPPLKTTFIGWIAGGGLDYRFGSDYALRLQVDYLGSHLGGAYQRNLQAVVGIVRNF